MTQGLLFDEEPVCVSSPSFRYPITRAEADVEEALGARYRYSLLRAWDAGEGRVTICGVNPSEANATKNDPTLVRCVNFAQGWGFRELVMVNLFALISTKPSGLRAVADPVGPRNDKALLAAVAGGGRFVVAWGDGIEKAPRALRSRDAEVLRLLEDAGVRVECMGYTDDGRKPRHPLMLKKSTALEPFVRSP